MIIKITQKNPSLKKVMQVVDVLKKGGVIAYPTDTAYGIGCDIFDKKAVNKINFIKKRSKNNPYSFICDTISSITSYAVVTTYSHAVLTRFLPGPYTFILKAKENIPFASGEKQRTVGIRIPVSQLCKSIVYYLGSPIVTTSANISGEPPLCNPSIIQKKFNNQIDLVIDDGNIYPEPSTVIDISSDKPIVLRKGKGAVDFFLTDK